MSNLSEWSQSRGVGISWVAAGLTSVAIGGTALVVTATKAADPLITFWTIILVAGAVEAIVGATVWLRWLLRDYNALKFKAAGLP